MNENNSPEEVQEGFFQTKQFRMVVALVSIILVATVGLEGAYMFTKDIIAKNQATKIQKGVLYALGMDDSTEGLEQRFNDHVDVRTFIGPDGKDFNVWVGKDDSGNLMGYVIRLTGGGFQGVVDIVVGLSADLNETTGMQVINSGETPGLGDNMRNEDFRVQFVGMSTQPRVDFIKYREPTPDEPNKFQAITGATFTTAAIKKFLNVALEFVRPLKEAGEIEVVEN
jgi:electron transport complex protein RnfG